MERKAIILIGMPGSGKSTVGVLLAKAARREFVDTDLLIQNETGSALQDILDREGVSGFLSIEESIVTKFLPGDAVVATGGSVVYSEAAMKHLSTRGIFVYLECSAAVLERRLSNLDIRGVGHDDHEHVVREILDALKPFDSTT
jgi:shikimate kinase